jgi:type VI secretion system protein
LPPGKTLAASLVFLVVAACGTTRSFFGGNVTVEILTDPVINQDSPVQVELLVIYDDQLLQQVLAQPAQSWFAKRQTILRNYPGTESFLSRYWELVPGQPRFQEELSFAVGARATVVFANYASPGDHRVLMDPHQDLYIHLGETDVSVSPLQQ